MLLKKVSLLFFYILISTFCFSQTKWKSLEDSLASHRVLLPNGWSLTPVGRSMSLGDLPLNIAVSGSGKYLAVSNNGVGTQTIQLVDAVNEKLLNEAIIPASWLGIKFSDDEKYLFASEGNDNQVLRYLVRNDSLVLNDSFLLGSRWPEKISPAGIDADDQYLYVVTKEDNSLYIFDLSTKHILKKIPLHHEAYTCLLSPDRRSLYISLWGGDEILLFDTKRLVITDSVHTGRNPNDLCVTKNGKFLFVANAVSNSVSVIDVQKKKVIETLNAALYADAPEGSTTNSVALSSNDKTLFIANADNNCVAVFDISKPGNSRSKGFIPVGWYPTCVRVVANDLFVANAKGFSSMANPDGPQPVRRAASKDKKDDNANQYIGSLFKGTLSKIPQPGADELSIYSKLVYENTPYSKEKEMQSEGDAGNPVPMKKGDSSPIKHVFYIIKENRTYDQVLGDMPEGNGDSGLVLFGEKITPNEHALARQFVLLDNFYVDAEVSADGHNWSMAAYANDYVEKTWPTLYGDRGGTFDYSGNRAVALPRNGFIWDYALRAGISVRNYGEFVDEGKVSLKDLAKNTCGSYVGWNLSVQDVYREKEWEHDFDSLAANHSVPQLNIIYLPNDHTSGLTIGAFTPFAHVADNDLALGKLVEHLSQSSVWGQSAVFVLEDDAQNGPDHVDAHRSTAFVISPFVRHNFIDHTMYSTSGILRTMELILGLPAMSQYDAGAVPLWRSFTPAADNTPFAHHEPGVDINEKNVVINDLSRESDSFDFAGPDDAPDLELNDVLWKSIRGISSSSPSPHRAAFVTLHPSTDRDK